MKFEVEPQDALIDEPVRIHLTEAPAATRVVLRAELLSPYPPWSSQASFVADAQGEVDATRDAPVAGDYDVVDGMGLFWSMTLDPETNRKLMSGEISPFLPSPIDPLRLRFNAKIGDTLAASIEVTRRFLARGIVRTPVREDGLVATLFHHNDRHRPAVVVLGGSGGGLDEAMAALIASRGYTTLALAYFAMEGLPADLYEIPLEYFGRAIEWLQRSGRAKEGKIAVIGGSRGGELALLLGATFPQIRAVVGYVPSGVTWAGIGRDPSSQPRAAWTLRGKPIAFVPAPTNPDPALLSAISAGGGAQRITPWFLACLRDAESAERAEIAVERINGPVLLISGKDDQMWPSEKLADIAVTRMLRHGFHHPVEHVSYEGAGHAIRFPYTPAMLEIFHPITKSALAFGGSLRANAIAQEDSWRKLLQFLGEHLT